ncbi:MAG: pyridoxamine 5'-phosphate oxidase family protein [Sphingobium sp.]
MNEITSVTALEEVIGKAPPAIHLKVIDHLDESALRWLAASPLMFAGFGGAEGLHVTLGGGKPGFAGGDAHSLRLPLALLDDPGRARKGLAFGSLFLAPGIGETLRINGHVAEVTGETLGVAVEQCYVHCAKALIRSDFWTARPLAEVPHDPATFVAASRFLALATMDEAGGADLSPKGDPAGTMARLEGGTLLFADRPGNRRADSHRNIIAQPHVAGLLLIPGSDHVAMVEGTAALTTDEAARAPFAVRDRTPLLVTRVDGARLSLMHSPSLARARLWPLEEKARGIDPARMFAAHVKLNKGLKARIAGAVMSIPGLMQKGLDKDYRDNLY